MAFFVVCPGGQSYSIHHRLGHTIYEDRTGRIIVKGIFYSREDVEWAICCQQLPYKEVD